MTPTATVCLMSRTANRPRGGEAENGSTDMGLEGAISTMAASPFLMVLGKASNSLPERRSHLLRISSNLQAMWAVWQSMTGALKFLHSLAGSFLESEATLPRRISLTETFLT